MICLKLCFLYRAVYLCASCIVLQNPIMEITYITCAAANLLLALKTTEIPLPKIL